jgi:UDP-N-acetylglucosamine 2-epimerase (non-hydrolysing)
LKRPKKIISVVGARPNFMKLAPVEREFRKFKRLIVHKIVHTGQHYDYKLSKIFFKDLELPEPDIYLGVGSSSHADQTARIMEAFEAVVLKEKPDIVMVFGDVNSTLACSLVCSKIIYRGKETIPVAHIEAGLRSFDRTMPEEINRIVTDNISKFLFVTEKAGVDNLIDEGISKKKIYLVGDVMIDSLTRFRKKFDCSRILKKLNLLPGEFVLTTIHRPSNVDGKSNLKKILSILSGISEYLADGQKILFPAHPRSLKMMRLFGLKKSFNRIKKLVITEPIGYADFIKLLKSCKFILTDSGGIQEEATFLRVPCLTLRDSFERPETISIGSNTLCGLDAKLIFSKVKEILEGKYKKGRVPKHMDGNASKRIVKILINNLLQ